MSQRYSRLPSEIMRIADDYTAFCFDEACCYIAGKIENGDKPIWRNNEDEETAQMKQEYHSFTDFYSDIIKTKK